jgi:hypothetical protein
MIALLNQIEGLGSDSAQDVSWRARGRGMTILVELNGIEPMTS